MHKNKILFVIPGYSLGGTTSSLASLLNSEFSDRYDVKVFSINRRSYSHPTLAAYDIGLNDLTTAFNADYSTFSTIERLKYFPIKLLKQITPFANCLWKWIERKTIRRIESRNHYDYVIAFQEGNTTKFTSHFENPNKIAWIHCDYTMSAGNTINELEIYKQYKIIVCVSNYTRKSFVAHYPSLGEKTVAIYNLFDAEKIIYNSKANIEDSRFDRSHFTILSIGRICEVKRFYLIPEIAKKIKLAGLDFRWYILGGGNKESDLRRLDDAIIQNGVENEVLYLGAKANPYPYLKAADLMVSTSKSEACPMVFNEAKLLHVPILSADFGSSYEFIENEKTGWICPIEEMAKKISEIMSNQKEYLSVKNNLKDFWFDNEPLLKQIESVLS